MAPVPPEGMTTSTLITAKGSELKFWITKTNEAAEKKVLNVSGTVDHLRANLAAYYGLDLTTNPRLDIITAPTIDESIRDRQWADLAMLGVEWKETVKAGGVFTLVKATSDLNAAANPSIMAVQSLEDSRDDVRGSTSVLSLTTNTEPRSGPCTTMSVAPNGPVSLLGPRESVTATQHTYSHSHLPMIPVAVDTSTPSNRQSSALPSTGPSAPSKHEAVILEDLSQVIAGLQRCEGLRAVIQQIESGAVQRIRDQYGPSEYGHRGTANAVWPKYSNLVSKRERLHRILTQDFEGNKEKFFHFFTVPASSSSKKRKRPSDEPEEHLRSFRKIVEAIPWCETDLATERQKDHYLGADGEFTEALWIERWAGMNSWEVWRAIGREIYEGENFGLN